MTFDLQPLSGEFRHGLVPRYVSLTANPGAEIPIPTGTTRLGVWVYGNSTWAEIKLGVKNKDGDTRFIKARDRQARMADNFDGWRFVDTNTLRDEAFLNGEWVINRIAVTMPEQQVYVDELLTTANPRIAVWGVHAIRDIFPPITYQPW